MTSTAWKSLVDDQAAASDNEAESDTENNDYDYSDPFLAKDDEVQYETDAESETEDFIHHVAEVVSEIQQRREYHRISSELKQKYAQEMMDEQLDDSRVLKKKRKKVIKEEVDDVDDLEIDGVASDDTTEPKKSEDDEEMEQLQEDIMEQQAELDDAAAEAADVETDDTLQQVTYVEEHELATASTERIGVKREPIGINSTNSTGTTRQTKLVKTKPKSPKPNGKVKITDNEWMNGERFVWEMKKNKPENWEITNLGELIDFDPATRKPILEDLLPRHYTTAKCTDREDAYEIFLMGRGRKIHLVTREEAETIEANLGGKEKRERLRAARANNNKQAVMDNSGRTYLMLPRSYYNDHNRAKVAAANGMAENSAIRIMTWALKTAITNSRISTTKLRDEFKAQSDRWDKYDAVAGGDTAAAWKHAKSALATEKEYARMMIFSMPLFNKDIAKMVDDTLTERDVLSISP
jgi:hypothetical protein